MKKDRNCSNPYPIYPPYQPMMGYVGPQYMTEQNDLQQQINKLERRVSNLENMFNSNNISYSNTNYNSSNYQMM